MFVTYALIAMLNVGLLGLFNYVGLDFRTFYTSAQIAQSEGFASIYNLETQQEYQLRLYEDYRTNADVPAFETVPTPYFPVFLLPFFIFLPFSPSTGFSLFTFLNIAGFILYMRRLVTQFGVREEKGWVIAASLTAVPVFFNLFYGQINILLLVALGEFLLAAKREQGYRSGLWLSLWLVKPQALLFILPWLLFSRKGRNLAGFCIGALTIFLASTILAGWDWPILWFKLLILYPQNLATTNPLAMMNWRSLVLHLEQFSPSWLAWTVGLLGMLITTYGVLRTWPRNKTEQHFELALLANLAGTFAVTWHSHLHMATTMLVPLIALLGSNQLSYKRWMGVLGVQFLGLIGSIVARVWFPENNLLGTTFLAVNLFLVYWGYQHTNSEETMMHAQ